MFRIRNDADSIALAAARAARAYNVERGLVQDWLKPTTMLLLDGLLGEDGEIEATGHDTLWVAVNHMRKDEDRTWVGQRSRVHVEHYEVLVDFHYFRGSRMPYRTIMTAESEGFAPEVARLARTPIPGPGEEIRNGLLWDLWKLLIVPSPLRVFTTIASAVQHDAVRAHFAGILGRYADLEHHGSPFALVCFDPDGAPEASVRVSVWPAGAWKGAPREQIERLAENKS